MFAPDPFASGQAARDVWSSIGAAFFQALAEHLAKALDAELVYVGELVAKPKDRVKPVAARGGKLLQGRLERVLAAMGEDGMAGSAAGGVIERGMSIHDRGAWRLFPADPAIRETAAEAYAGVALYDSHGQPIGLIAVLFRHPLADVAPVRSMLQAFAPRTAAELERKRTDDALRESEWRYRVFIEQNTDAMWRVEFDPPIPIDLPEDEQIEAMLRYGYIAECNEAFAALLHVPGAERLIGVRLGELTHALDPHIIDGVRSTIHSGYHSSMIEITGPGLDGNPIYRLRSQSGIVENGMLYRIWGISRDIASLRKAELEWQTSEIRFRNVLEHTRMAAVILDTDGKVTFCNDAAVHLTGWPKERIAGANWFDLTAPADAREEVKARFVEAIADSREFEHFEQIVATREGAHRRVEWDRTILRDSQGRVMGVASLGRDVTDQLAIEAQFRHSQKMESVGRLAGSVAHDFNNLLTVINGFSELLLDAHGEGDPLHAAAEEIRNAGQRGAELARQLLAFSRKQPVSPRPLNLNEIVAASRHMLERLIGNGIELVTNLDPSLGYVMADPGQVHQVLMNLLVNARDAMAGGGTATIESANVEAAEGDREGMRGVTPGSYVMLSVTDTGVGMTEEVRAHLFEPFFTTKQPGHGTGLGLSTVYGIIHQSGGHILVESEPGKGATFRILLPRVPQPQSSGSTAG
jgi:two-component system cell cycle sensor histidine kinase/response regulator CckA